MRCLIRGRLPDSGRAVDLVIRDGRIQRIARAGRAAPDLGHAGCWFLPPLFDIQVNGAAGVDLQSPALEAGDLHEITGTLARQGIAKWIPTLITGPLEIMERNCRVIAEACAHDKVLSQAIPGIHLEGPVISPADGPRGAHPRAHVRPPSLRDLDRLRRAAKGFIRYTTVAPELPRAIPYIAGAAARGIVVSLGHHDAAPSQIAEAVRAGAVLCTHLGNGMAARIDRHRNPLWPQLADDRLQVSLIADGHHLPDDALKTFVRAKTARRVILVSDCVPLMGLPPGRYDLFGARVRLTRDGKVALAGTELLAGSAVPLAAGVLRLARAAGITMMEAIECARGAPARLLGVRMPRWSLSEGDRPSFLLADPGGMHPAAVFRRGERLDNTP